MQAPDNTPAETAVREPAWDYLRLVAAIAVIGIHALAPYAAVMRASGGLTGWLYRLDRALFVAVPLFLFVSGALVWGRAGRMGLGAYGTFLKRRARVIGVPYLAWSALYFALWPIVGREWPHGVRSGAALVWSLVVSGSTQYHLYYVPLLFILYLLTPIARRIGELSPELVLALVLMVRVLWGPAIVSWTDGTWDRDAYTYLAEHAVINMPYMALGAWFALRRTTAERVVALSWPLLLVAGWLTFPFASYRMLHDWSPYLERTGEFVATSVLILGLFGLARWIGGMRSSDAGRVAAAASLTYGVYLAHPFALFVIRRALGELGHGEAMGAPPAGVMIWVTVTFLSFALVWAGGRFKATSWAFGVER